MLARRRKKEPSEKLPQVAKMLDELQDQAASLRTEYDKLESQYNEVKDYYSHKKFQERLFTEYKLHLSQQRELKGLYSNKTSYDLASKNRAMQLNSQELVVTESKLKIIEDLETTLSLVQTELNLFEQYQAKLKQIAKENKEINEKNEFNKKLLLSMIWIAAEEFCRQCNAILEKESNSSLKEQLLVQAMTFAALAPVTYKNDSSHPFSFECIPQAETYPIEIIVRLVNESIKTENTEKKSSATVDSVACLKDAIKNNVILKETVSFDKELRYTQKAASLMPDDLDKNIHALKIKYAPVLSRQGLDYKMNQEISSISGFAEKTKNLSVALEKLKPEALTKLTEEVKGFQVIVDLSIEQASNYLKSFSESLKKELKDNSPRMDCYQAYKRYQNAFENIQGLSNRLMKEASFFRRKFEELGNIYDGPLLKQKQKEMEDAISQYQGRLRKFIRGAHIDLDSKMKKEFDIRFTKEELVKRVLKFLNNTVLSDSNIENFWHQQTTTWHLCCFGYKIRIGEGDQKKYIATPTLVGKIKNELRNTDITTVPFYQLEQLLFENVHGIMLERLKNGAGRKLPTTALLNALRTLTTGGIENFTEQKVKNFEEVVSAITDRSGKRLVNVIESQTVHQIKL